MKIENARRFPVPAEFAFPAGAVLLIAPHPERIVWGTDWPHPNSTTPPGSKLTDVTPLFQIDDGRLMSQLPIWAPDATTRKMILVDNPARLYRF